MSYDAQLLSAAKCGDVDAARVVLDRGARIECYDEKVRRTGLWRLRVTDLGAPQRMAHVA
jgi:hypothetical protein